jgi:hypothetical protein
MVVHAAEATVAWSVGSDSNGRSSARRLAWRRSSCLREHNEEGMSESGKEWRLAIHLWRQRGRQGIETRIDLGGAWCGHQRHALVHASPLEQKHDLVAGREVVRLESNLGLLRAKSGHGQITGFAHLLMLYNLC